MTLRSRATGSSSSRIACASASLSSRLLATRSARRPGSSRLATMTMTSGEIDFPSCTAFSSSWRTLRTSASTSRVPGGSGWSVSCSIFACRKGSVCARWTTRARATPCTRMRMRPSGSFSMRMMLAAVPTSKRSAGCGSSTAGSRCATSISMRFSASERSTAWMLFSRATDSGRMMKGKSTMSRSGSTGSRSGSCGVSSGVCSSLILRVPRGSPRWAARAAACDAPRPSAARR